MYRWTRLINKDYTDSYIKNTHLEYFLPCGTYMKKIAFQFVEDYIEHIAGHQPRSGSPLFKVNPILRLARYDIQVLSGLSVQTLEGIAFSDRQAELAVKLLEKYRRQLYKLDIDVASHTTTPVYRMPLRTVERLRTVSIRDKLIIIKFPFSPVAIEDLEHYAKSSAGKIKYDKILREWQLAITEPNVQLAKQFADKFTCEESPEFAAYIQAVDQCENAGYNICLHKLGNALAISNAETSLLTYISQKIGAVDQSNLLALVDQAPILGYTVDCELFNEVIADVEDNTIIRQLLRDKELRLATTTDSKLDEIFKYAALTNRWPVYVFDNMPLQGIRAQLNNYFDADQIVNIIDKTSDFPVLPANTKCVYLTQWRSQWETGIPLLISTTSMMWGGMKRHLVQCAGKVVYYSDQVYNH